MCLTIIKSFICPKKKREKKTNLPRNLKALDVAVSTPGPGEVEGGRGIFHPQETQLSLGRGVFSGMDDFHPKIGVFGEFRSFVQWKMRTLDFWLLFCAAMLGSLLGFGNPTLDDALPHQRRGFWMSRRCKECTVRNIAKNAPLLQTGLRCLVFKRSTNSQSSTRFSLIQRVLYWKKVMKQLNLCGGCWFLRSTVPKT